MSVITFGEVAEGVYFSQHRAVAMQRWHELLSPLEVVDVTREIAEIWADLRGSLRRRGLIVADNDLLIGSTAIRHDLTVYTRNARHFSRINGLKVEVARDDE
jgi:predicted nucleic acid-binding protein